MSRLPMRNVPRPRAVAVLAIPNSRLFTPTDLGWQLYRQRFEIVLDNTQNNQEFNCIFQGGT